ncbi:hypothetical protein BHE74_00043874, partial [Ensete ventricosum]
MQSFVTQLRITSYQKILMLHPILSPVPDMEEIDSRWSIEEEKGKKKKRKKKKKKKKKKKRRSTSRRPSGDSTRGSPTSRHRPRVARESSPPAPPTGDFSPHVEESSRR